MPYYPPPVTEAAIQPAANYRGLLVSSIMETGFGAATAGNINGVNAARWAVGRVVLEGGSGSKTISSAGGKIYIATGAVTFADAGSTVRVGIQDVAATGLPDGTFDVYEEIVGGTDTVTANVIRPFVMDGGTKTVTHGDLIAVGIKMSARGGADSIGVNVTSGGPVGSPQFPYGEANGAKDTRFLPHLIEFDDGTVGWVDQAELSPGVYAVADLAHASNTTPDEYAAIFKLPFKSSLGAAALWIGGIAASDDFEIILYSDPFGTPTAVETYAVDATYTQASGTNGPVWAPFSSQTLEADTYYAIASRPTTTGSIDFGYYNMGSGNENVKRASPFGAEIKLGSRTNQTGAFAETQTYHMPHLQLRLNGFLG
jgi:hypothetical protein